MSKYAIGMTIYGVALFVGVLLLIANFGLHLFDKTPNGFRIAIIAYAGIWMVIRIVLARQGYFTRSRPKPDAE